MKLKLLALAALALVGSTSAFAGNPPGTADLLLVVGDTNGQTYTEDLGAVSTFISGAGSTETFNVPTGSVYGTTITGLSASNTVFWGVVALNGSTQVYTSAPLANWGATPTPAQVNNVITQYTQFNYPDLAAFEVGTTSEYTGNTTQSDPTNAANILQIAGKGSNAFAGAGATEGFTVLNITGSRSATGGAFTGGASNPNFSFNSATGQLVWDAQTPPPPSVPLPAAVWLLGSGLLGLLGIGRRRAA